MPLTISENTVRLRSIRSCGPTLPQTLRQCAPALKRFLVFQRLVFVYNSMTPAQGVRMRTQSRLSITKSTEELMELLSEMKALMTEVGSSLEELQQAVFALHTRLNEAKFFRRSPRPQ